GIQLSVINSTTANLLVNFDQTKLVRAIHNLAIPLTLQIDANNIITGCAAAGSAAALASAGGTCPSGQVMNGISANGVPSCVVAAAGGSTTSSGTGTAVGTGGGTGGSS